MALLALTTMNANRIHALRVVVRGLRMSIVYILTQLWTGSFSDSCFLACPPKLSQYHISYIATPSPKFGKASLRTCRCIPMVIMVCKLHRRCLLYRIYYPPCVPKVSYPQHLASHGEQTDNVFYVNFRSRSLLRADFDSWI